MLGISLFGAYLVRNLSQTRKLLILNGIPNGIRTRVAALKGHSLRPQKAAMVR